LPTAATRSDLEVVVSGKLTDMCHDPKCVQVVITEQGEKLLLRDMGGIFLIILPASSIPGKSPSPSEGSWSEETDDLSGELIQLHNLLQGLEEEKVALIVETESNRVEVTVLKFELSKANAKTLDLCQENCE